MKDPIGKRKWIYVFTPSLFLAFLVAIGEINSGTWIWGIISFLPLLITWILYGYGIIGTDRSKHSARKYQVWESFMPEHEAPSEEAQAKLEPLIYEQPFWKALLYSFYRLKNDKITLAIAIAFIVFYFVLG